jgi:hypothetical protein
LFGSGAESKTAILLKQKLLEDTPMIQLNETYIKDDRFAKSNCDGK